jgi:hypothetical protein
MSPKEGLPPKKEKLVKRREVQVVKCPSAFPISTKTKAGGGRKRSRDDFPAIVDQRSNNHGHGRDVISSSNNNNSSNTRSKDSATNLLDWHETAKEIRAFGATAFVGQQRRDYQDEQYFRLTGRHKKKQKVPLPIVRGVKKAAAKREAKEREEARQAGIIIPKSSTGKDSKKSDSTYRVHGPAPSIGFMKNGVYKVSKSNTKTKSKQR